MINDDIAIPEWTHRDELRHNRPGLQNFARWFRESSSPRTITPTDVDGVINDDTLGEHGLNFWWEVKPTGVYPKSGQLRALQSNVKRGDWAFILWDDLWNDLSTTKLQDDYVINIEPVPPSQTGWVHRPLPVTVVELNNIIKDFHEGGNFSDYLVRWFGTDFSLRK